MTVHNNIKSKKSRAVTNRMYQILSEQRVCHLVPSTETLLAIGILVFNTDDFSNEYIRAPSFSFL